MADPHPVVQLAERFRRQIDQRDAAALGRVTSAYRGLYARLQGDMDALLLAIGNLENPTPAQVRKLAQYRRLMDDTDRELSRYTAWLETEIGNAARESIQAGSANARDFIRVGTGIRGAFRELPAEVIETLLGFLDPAGPLYARLALLPGYVAGQIAEAIVQGIGLGFNPRTTARELARRFGMALTDSLRMMRTVQLWSYREASRASYVANKDVVQGWIWWSRLDESVCLGCAAEHGTFHTVEESLNGHYNCRCAMLPVSVGMVPGSYIKTTGEQWFNGLPEAQQRKIMGPGKFKAWKEGKFQFGQLASEHEDEVYGPMLIETPLKNLVPVEAE